MSMISDMHGHEHSELVCLYALHALPPGEVAGAEAQIGACGQCRDELDGLRSLVDSFVSWPTDVLVAPATLWDRLAQRVAAESGKPVLPASNRWVEPPWKEVAPGISVKILSSDMDASRVAMLVRLEPGTDYPPHTHAGIEELHLLRGELWIDDRKLRPGDYNRADAGTSDRRVWSETGCTCVLITSPRDILG